MFYFFYTKVCDWVCLRHCASIYWLLNDRSVRWWDCDYFDWMICKKNVVFWWCFVFNIYSFRHTHTTACKWIIYMRIFVFLCAQHRFRMCVRVRAHTLATDRPRQYYYHIDAWSLDTYTCIVHTSQSCSTLDNCFVWNYILSMPFVSITPMFVFVLIWLNAHWLCLICIFMRICFLSRLYVLLSCQSLWTAWTDTFQMIRE